MTEYGYVVNSGASYTIYAGYNIADAMAAFTGAILDGDEYVTLKALRKPSKPLDRT